MALIRCNGAFLIAGKRERKKEIGGTDANLFCMYSGKEVFRVTDGAATFVADMDKFLAFIEQERPMLSAKRGMLGKKDAFRLNEQLHERRDVSAPNYVQEAYPAVDLLFQLAMEGALLRRGEAGRGKSTLLGTPALESYRKLRREEKYVYLVQTWWTRYPFVDHFSEYSQITSYYLVLVQAASGPAGQRIMKDEAGHMRKLFSEDADFLRHLRCFGWGETEEVEENRATKYEEAIRAFVPNEFGVRAAALLISEQALVHWNHAQLPLLLETLKLPDRKRRSRKKEHPFEAFRSLFPEGVVQGSVDAAAQDAAARDAAAARTGAYTFKVKLSGNVWRMICMSSRHTLHHLHLAIQDAFDLDDDDDHLYAFFMDGKKWSDNAYYCSEEGAGKDIPAEDAIISEIGLYVGQRILYLFDFGDEWTFDVKLVTIDDTVPEPLRPIVTQSRGEAPEQYSDW